MIESSDDGMVNVNESRISDRQNSHVVQTDQHVGLEVRQPTTPVHLEPNESGKASKRFWLDVSQPNVVGQPESGESTQLAEHSDGHGRQSIAGQVELGELRKDVVRKPDSSTPPGYVVIVAVDDSRFEDIVGQIERGESAQRGLRGREPAVGLAHARELIAS